MGANQCRKAAGAFSGSALYWLALCWLAVGCGSRSELSKASGNPPSAEPAQYDQILGLDVGGLSQSECLENWETLLEDSGVSNGSVGIANGLVIFPWVVWGGWQFEVRGFELAAPQGGHL